MGLIPPSINQTNLTIMAKMNFAQFMDSVQGGDLKLISFEKNANGKLVKATSPDGSEVVMSTNNLKKAVEAGTAVPDDDGVTIPDGNYSLADSGLTLISYGGGLDLTKEKFN